MHNNSLCSEPCACCIWCLVPSGYCHLIEFLHEPVKCWLQNLPPSVRFRGPIWEWRSLGERTETATSSSHVETQSSKNGAECNTFWSRETVSRGCQALGETSWESRQHGPSQRAGAVERTVRSGIMGYPGKEWADGCHPAWFGGYPRATEATGDGGTWMAGQDWGVGGDVWQFVRRRNEPGKTVSWRDSKRWYQNVSSGRHLCLVEKAMD